MPWQSAVSAACLWDGMGCDVILPLSFSSKGDIDAFLRASYTCFWINIYRVISSYLNPLLHPYGSFASTSHNWDHPKFLELQSMIKIFIAFLCTHEHLAYLWIFVHMYSSTNNCTPSPPLPFPSCVCSRPRATAEARNEGGQSLLSIAAQHDHEELAIFLLQYWKECDKERWDLGKLSDH